MRPGHPASTACSTTPDGVDRGLWPAVGHPAFVIEHHFAPIGGPRTHYVRTGEGDAIVLLHGWPQHWWMWRHLIPALAKRHLVVCPDIRGLGWSDAGGDATAYRLDRLAGDLVGLLDHLGLERVSLVGHDWGTAIGYEACLRSPQRFRRFVALAGTPPWRVGGSSLALALRLWHIPAIAALGSMSITRLRIAERALRDWRHVGSFSAAEYDAYLSVIVRREVRAATVHFYRNIILHESSRYLIGNRSTQLAVPTLHLNGRHDHHFQHLGEVEPSRAVDFAFDVLPCGHFIAEEVPRLLLERVLDFVDRT